MEDFPYATNMLEYSIIKGLICLLCIGVYIVTSIKIECGETKTGYKGRGKSFTFEFKSDSAYDTVSLNACDSEFDSILECLDSNGNSILEIDDDETGICADNPFAGYITIPKKKIKKNDEYSFILSGYDQSEQGSYSVKLICEKKNPTPQPTPKPTPRPTKKPTKRPTKKPTEGNDCPRIREPWHLISDEKRSLFINGFKQLAKSGKLAVFVQVHGIYAEHRNSKFLPWHRYYIWELETQIRALGKDFECFGLPYWYDTHDICIMCFYGIHILLNLLWIKKHHRNNTQGLDI